MEKNWAEKIIEAGEAPVRVRRVTYKGRGRPRDEDYAVVKTKDLKDFFCYERLLSGFKTHYTHAD